MSLGGFASQFGATALVATISLHDTNSDNGSSTWQYLWHTARRQCLKLTAEFEASNAKRAVCLLLVQRAKWYGDLSSFLEAVMDLEEQAVVESFLYEQALIEELSGNQPAQAEDEGFVITQLLVLFLLKRNNTAFARRVHEQHQQAVSSNVGRSRKMLEAREILLEAHMQQRLLHEPTTVEPSDTRSAHAHSEEEQGALIDMVVVDDV